MQLTRRVLFIATLVLFNVVPAAANKDFIVFFLGPNPEQLDSEQWRVTVEGDAVLKEAASAYREWGGFILVSGHDQRVGSAANAMVRSQRRADAVVELLISYGVPQSALSTKACGWPGSLF